MNKNFFKCFITLFIFIIGSLIIINFTKEIKLTSSFKRFGGNMEVGFINNDCYQELKKSIDETVRVF